MKVQFEHGGYLANGAKGEVELLAVPRLNETVILPDGLTGVVTNVVWQATPVIDRSIGVKTLGAPLNPSPRFEPTVLIKLI